jgi:hypothetical protein
MPKNVGVRERVTWSDSFYLEALMRFETVWDPYWRLTAVCLSHEIEDLYEACHQKWQ